MNFHRKTVLFLSAFFLLIIFNSCKSTNIESTKKIPHKSKHNELNLVILGDVMAHTGNFVMKDYNIIWNGIRDITSSSDFTFANIEAPVSNTLPFMNYPNFNMQYSYPQAAIDAGVNVMTVANNHTNDQFEEGIKSTDEWTKFISKKYEKTKRKVYFSGLKQDVSSVSKAKESPCSFSYFEKNGIKVLFLGATQLLNAQICKEMINYFPGTEDGKKQLISTVKKLKEENPADLFVLALHTEEPEYILEVTKTQKQLYEDLLAAGVDILWANHPHTPKPIEWRTDPETGLINKIILYATGNTISSQRFYPNFENPARMREYTGDGFCVGLSIKKKKDYTYIENCSLTFITNIVDENKNVLIKKLDQNLFDELKKAQNIKMLNYLKKREELLKQIEGTLSWL